jgi:hypothetical protein
MNAKPTPARPTVVGPLRCSLFRGLRSLQKTLEEDELRTAREHRRAPPDWTCLPSVSLLLSVGLSLSRGSETPALSQRCKISVA